MTPVTTIFALFFLAVAIRSSLRLMYGMRRAGDGDVIHLALVIVSWMCMTLSILFASVLFLWFFSIPLWIFIGITLLTSWVRYRQMQRKALLAMIAKVAENNLPPEPALLAFAEGHPNAIGRAANRIAQLLSGGALLTGAMTICERSLPRFTRVFAQAGAVSGSVAPALREVNQLEAPGRIVANALAGRVFYLCFLVLGWVFIGTFVMSWIMPTFKIIFADFDMDLPVETQMVIGAADWFGQYWFLFTPFFMLFVFFPLLILFFWKLYDYQWISEIPVIEQFDPSLHRAVVLRSMALSADKNQPLGPVLRSLSMNYPRAFMGRKLWNVAGDVEAGECWYVSMEREKLISPSDAAVLKSAERVGNLAWAMRMIADRGIRRSAYRMQAVLNWIAPLMVIAIGLGVMFFVTGLFLPLVQIILDLS